MKHTAYLGIGSNLGDRLHYLRQALDHIDRIPGCRIVQMSSIYETKAVGNTEQPDFLNGAVQLQTKLDPFELLENCQTIEAILGRKKTRHWGPRVIDIDILTIDSIQINTHKLTVPHRELQNRKFVLIPLQELSADLVIPISDKTVSKVLRECPDQSWVKLYLTTQEFIKMVKEGGK